MDLFEPVLVAMSLAETLIVVLILVFLTVPSALLILDRARSREPAGGDRDEAPRGAGQMQGPRFQVHREPFHEAVRVEATDAIPHAFDEGDPLPPNGARTLDYARTEGEVDTGGLLHLGAASRHYGDIRILGHLGVGHGATVEGDLHVAGDLRLGPEARIEGTVTVQGDAYLGRRAEVEGELQAARVLLDSGAGVDGPARCARVVHGPGAAAFEDVPGVYERTAPGAEVPPEDAPAPDEEEPPTVDPQTVAAAGDREEEGPA